MYFSFTLLYKQTVMGSSKIGYFFAIIFITSMLFSCNQGSNNDDISSKLDNSVDTLAVNDSITKRMKALADSLDLAEANYEDLLKLKKGNDFRNRVFYRKIHLLQQENDSLKTLLNEFQNNIDEHSNPMPQQASTLSQDEKEIQDMIISLNQAWVRMHQTRKPKEVLRFFNTQFIVSWIVIETDNSANAAHYTQNDFGNFLRRIIQKKEYSFEFGDVSFFDIEVKGHKYFKAAFNCELRVYKGDVMQYKDSVLVTIAGKKIKKKWKIASYSWIGFKYKLKDDDA